MFTYTNVYFQWIQKCTANIYISILSRLEMSFVTVITECYITLLKHTYELK
jgi:hypothetical protein